MALLATVIASAQPASAAVIGVLSDGRQASYLSLLGDSSAAARLALQGDGHSIASINSLGLAVLDTVDVVWLPVLNPSATYTAQERVNLVQYLNEGGRVVFIGDADVFNLPDNSFLAALNTTKRIGNLNTALAPAMPGHPVISGPHGSVGLVGASAGYGLFNGVPTVANVFTAASGPGTFAGFMDASSGFAGGGRLAIICDSSIFGQLLNQDGHLAFLRNTVKWAAATPGYTPSGSFISTGVITGGCDACVSLSAVFDAVSATGETSVAALGAGRCGITGIPDAAIPVGFVGGGFAITTSASQSGTVSLNLTYDPTELASLGIVDETALQLYWLHPTNLVLVNVTGSLSTATDMITGQAPGVGAFLLGAVVTPFADCNLNSVADECEIAGHDCNENDILDSCDIAGGLSQDIDGNGVPDECDPDCNGNGMPDGHDIAVGTEQDCNGNHIPDSCELASGGADCNDNDIPDSCDIAGGTSQDCNTNGVPDECETDCNENGVPDPCDITSGTSPDCNANSIPDECDLNGGSSQDCNDNDIPDSCDIAEGTSQDCNSNHVPDECDLAGGAADCNDNDIPDGCDIASGDDPDCNDNNVPDSCDIASGIWHDCNANGVPDICDIAEGTSPDCNHNGIPDSCDLTSGQSQDCNANGIPDSCDIAAGTTPDCNHNGVPDACDIAAGTPDCNGNGVPDSCDIAAGGGSQDCNHDSIPDDCQTDCNGNDVPDDCDLASGTAQDCNDNDIPDSCDIAAGTSSDCDGNGVPDECDPDCNGNNQPDACDIALGLELDCNANLVPDDCEVEAGTTPDCNANHIPDSCDIASGASQDCDNNQRPDECDPDCNANGQPDACDIASGTPDCNHNLVPDSCDIASGQSLDCNANGVPDSCDIATGTPDCNANGVPDSCDLATGQSQDCNGNGIPDSCDIVSGFSVDCNHNGVPDSCDPPYVADAGPAWHVCTGQTSPALGGPVVASGSNPPYQYTWQIVSGPAGGQIISPNAERAFFVSNAEGTYVVQVRVADASTPPCIAVDTTTITVATMSVEAGNGFVMGLGTTSAPLNAVVTGGIAPISYLWSIDAGSASTAVNQFTGNGPNSPNPTFTPAQPGPYTLRVTATDSNTPPCGVSDTVLINVTQVQITLGPDFAMAVNRDSPPLPLTVVAPGVAPNSYQWTIEPGSPSTNLSQLIGGGPTVAQPIFRPTSLGMYTLRATVQDSATPPSVATAVIHINVAVIVVDAGADASATVGGAGVRLAPVIEGGSPPLNYVWTIEAGSPTADPHQFSDPHNYAPAPLFRPAALGVYTLKLTVRDSGTPQNEASDTMVVRATAMTVDAGADFATPAFRPSKPLGAFPFVAGGSPPYTYAWEIVGGPDRAEAQLSSTTAEHPVFTPSATGVFIVRVRGSDSGSPPAIAIDEVVIEAFADTLTAPINVEGRAFMTLRLAPPFARAEFRLSESTPGSSIHGEIYDDGPTAVFTGLQLTPAFSRRAFGELAPAGPFVAVVVMYYGAEEAVGLDESALRLNRWDGGASVWRVAGSRAFEEAAYPNRSVRADVGRHGIDRAGRYVWAVTDQLGEYSVGLPDGSSGSQPSAFPGIAGGGCGAMAGPAMLLATMTGILSVSRRRRLSP